MTLKAKKLKKISKKHRNPEAQALNLNWHQKIAANRGERWKSRVVAGRREAILKPSALKLARLEKNLSQEPVAKHISMSKSVFGSVERGRRAVSPELARRIALFLDKRMQDLFVADSKGHFLAKQLSHKI